MFSASARESQQSEERESLNKRKNWSTTRRMSPYPVQHNSFPTHEGRDVLKTFQDSYDRLRFNAGVVVPRTMSPEMATEDNGEESHLPLVASNDSNTDNRDNNNLSYIGMIATAILQSPETKLTLAGIYTYMESHFLNILNTRPGWRNTVRHNLSLHDCFVKGEIAAEGKGRFWRIHPNYFEQFKCGKFNKNVLQNSVPPFYRTLTNYRLPGREEVQNAFPMGYHGAAWPSFYPFIPPSYPYPALPFRQTSPGTAHIGFDRQNYRDFQPFHFRQCPGDFCDGCSRVRQLPAALQCSTYGLVQPSLVIENGTRPSSAN